MTAQNGEGVYGDGVGVVTPLAHKLSQNGPVVKDSTGKPRSGVFYAGNASLVSGKANMSYDVAPFEAAICRGRTKGTSYPSNDAVVNVTTTAAPGSNSRIDIIYFQQQEVSEGDDATEAVVGVVQGTAASSPTAPTLPDGAIELARAVVGAGITATTDATITQTASFTAPLGSPVPFRTTTEMNAWTPMKGQRALDLSSDIEYRYNGTAWKPWESDWITYTTTLSAVSGTFAVGTGGSAAQVSRYRYEQGRVRVSFRLVFGTSGSSMGTAPKLTLPLAAVAPPHSNAAYVGGSLGGTIFDSSSGVARLLTVFSDDTSTTVVRLFYLDNVAGLLGSPTATAPWTWAAGDALQGEFVYDPA